MAGVQEVKSGRHKLSIWKWSNDLNWYYYQLHIIIYLIKQFNSWPTWPAGGMVIYSQLSTYPGEMEQLKNHPSTPGYQKILRTSHSKGPGYASFSTWTVSECVYGHYICNSEKVPAVLCVDASFCQIQSHTVKYSPIALLLESMTDTSKLLFAGLSRINVGSRNPCFSWTLYSKLMNFTASIAKFKYGLTV